MKKARILLLALAFFAISGTRATFAQALPSPIFQGLGQLTQNSFRTDSCNINLSSSTGVCLVANLTITPKPVEQPASPSQGGPKPKAEPIIEHQVNHAVIAQANVHTVQTQNPSNYVEPTVTLDSEKIFGMINDYRSKLGLTPFEEENSVCSLALTRSTEIPGEIQNGTLHSGLYNRNLPYWIWENAKYGSDEAGTVAWWLASHIHHASIIGDYKYSCVKCTNSYCSELFTSFVPK